MCERALTRSSCRNASALRNAANSGRFSSARASADGKSTSIRPRFERVAQFQRNVLPDCLGQIDAEQIEKIVLADAVSVSGLDQVRALVGQFDPRAQHVKLRHRPGVEPPLDVVQFAREQLHRGLVDGDLLRRHKDVVVSGPHRKQRVGQHSLVIEQRLLRVNLAERNAEVSRPPW